MAFHGDKQGVSGTIVQLTNDEDLTGAIRVANNGSDDIFLQATADGTAPANTSAAWAGSIKLGPRDVFVGELATYFPGVASAARVWGRFDNGGTASVSYA